MNKKAQVNQIFVYLVSIIIIVFVGFLVTKFIMGFTSDVELSNELKAYESIAKDLKAVYTNYGSEVVESYRVSSDVEYMCFAQDSSCIADLDELNDKQKADFEIIKQSGENAALFDSNDILTAQSIGEFNIKDTGCICIKPNNNYINLVIENVRNTVFISENN